MEFEPTPRLHGFLHIPAIEARKYEAGESPVTLDLELSREPEPTIKLIRAKDTS